MFLGYAKDTIQVTSKRCEEKIKNKTAMIEMAMYKVVLEKKKRRFLKRWEEAKKWEGACGHSQIQHCRCC